MGTEHEVQAAHGQVGFHNIREGLVQPVIGDAKADNGTGTGPATPGDGYTEGVFLLVLTHTFAVLPGQLFQALRSEEHTSELQSRGHLVCRLLLEKKNKIHSIS